MMECPIGLECVWGYIEGYCVNKGYCHSLCEPLQLPYLFKERYFDGIDYFNVLEVDDSVYDGSCYYPENTIKDLIECGWCSSECLPFVCGKEDGYNWLVVVGNRSEGGWRKAISIPYSLKVDSDGNSFLEVESNEIRLGFQQADDTLTFSSRHCRNKDRSIYWCHIVIYERTEYGFVKARPLQYKVTKSKSEFSVLTVTRNEKEYGFLRAWNIDANHYLGLPVYDYRYPECIPATYLLKSQVKQRKLSCHPNQNPVAYYRTRSGNIYPLWDIKDPILLQIPYENN